ncbi:hypothetical protein ABE437_07085 [Isoptericola cucumis]|uniref:hypothetical protein n=1 Tax=Isoptericola cucumis TaxID=1776856 RepID=UPI0032085E65
MPDDTDRPAEPTETDRAILVAREHDRFALRAATARGELRRVRRGAYRSVLGSPGPTAPGAAAPAPTPSRDRALERVGAVHRQLDAVHVFSHTTSALLWGIPLWRAPTTTHVLQRYRAGGTAASDITRHRPLPERWVELAGLPVTDLPRTVVDCLTTLHPLDGLVVADWALGHGVDPTELLRRLDARASRRGDARARHVLDLADGGATTPWETWLRYVALRAGLPRPTTQLPVPVECTTYFVDLAWREHRVLVEFDGRVKYTDGAFGAGYDADRARFDEKVREDAITEVMGVRPARFTARGARDTAAVTRRVLRLFPESVRSAARPDPRLGPPEHDADERAGREIGGSGRGR